MILRAGVQGCRRCRGVCLAQPTCSGFVSSASPVPQIKWRKVDGSLSPQWATAEPTLQIPSISFEDEGTYECEAENSKGRDTVQGRIIVQGMSWDTPHPASPWSLRKQIQKSGRALGGPLLRISCSGLHWGWEQRRRAPWPAWGFPGGCRKHVEGLGMI